MSNSLKEIINKSISSEDGDIRDKELLKKVFEKYGVDSVMHCRKFAGKYKLVNN